MSVMRRRRGTRVFLWVGLWSALHGARPLVDALGQMNLLPHWIQTGVPYLDTTVVYLVLVVALLAWLELSRDKLRVFLRGAVLIALAIALAGIALFLATGASRKLVPYNNLVAACTLAVLLTVVAVPRLARKFMVMPNRGVLLGGTLLFSAQAVYTNVLGALGYSSSPIWGTVGFAALLCSVGYVSLELVFEEERRLLSIDNELAIAHEIQTSILPARSPDMKSLHIAVAYRPMTAVAGDFYDFLAVDQNRLGVLVADVSGHGVPAALIAAMLKTAMESIVPSAHDPEAVLRGLNRVVSGQRNDQFVTAAYLWLDNENHRALYSAAGHPPLLLWREGKLERVDSNGIVFGATQQPDYPVCEMAIRPGDRFILYTDGVTEAQNGKREFFGDRMLEQVICRNESRTASKLVDELLAELGAWRPAPTAQQDDITLIVIDVV
jgi:sigma-B regulation protein RsbU (phosphoserine phosphatase)